MLDIDVIGMAASRTFVVPNPGSRSRSAIDVSENVVFSNTAEELLSGGNPLLRVANPLLNIVYQVRTLVHNSDPSLLRNYLIDEIKKFEQRAKSELIPVETIATARYCLCTVIDETAAQTPWGGGGVWAKCSLLVTFYNETWGGEKFFQIIARVTKNPALHRDLIELMFFCISLGFEGRYKVIPNGQSQLDLLRRRLAEIIADLNGGKEKSLSLHWRGIIKPRPPIWSVLPAWVSVLLFCLLATALFVMLSFRLSDQSDKVFSQIIATQVPVLSQPPILERLGGKVSSMLQDEIDQKLVAVDEVSGMAIVTLMGDGLFSSGSVTLNSRYHPVIQKISQSILDYGNGAIVSGHTDNIPIRSARFPSNWQLSQERARVVANSLAVANVNILKVQGVGDAEPKADNTTNEGRALNRRVEVKIVLRTANQ